MKRNYLAKALYYVVRTLNYLFNNIVHLSQLIFISLSFMLVATTAQATGSKDIGDLVGKWRVFDRVTSEHFYTINIQYDAATNSFIGVLSELGNKYKPYRICSRCQGNLFNQDLINQKILWGLTPKLDKEWNFTGIYDNGRVIDIRSGRKIKLQLNVSKSKSLMNVKHFTGRKQQRITASQEFWMRVD